MNFLLDLSAIEFHDWAYNTKRCQGAGCKIVHECRRFGQLFKILFGPNVSCTTSGQFGCGHLHNIKLRALQVIFSFFMTNLEWIRMRVFCGLNKLIYFKRVRALGFSYAFCLILARRNGWVRSSERVGGTFSAVISLDGGPSSFYSNAAYNVTVASCISCRVFRNVFKRWVVSTSQNLLWVTRHWRQSRCWRISLQVVGFLNLDICHCVRHEFLISRETSSIYRSKRILVVSLKLESWRLRKYPSVF